VPRHLQCARSYIQTWLGMLLLLLLLPAQSLQSSRKSTESQWDLPSAGSWTSRALASNLLRALAVIDEVRSTHVGRGCAASAALCPASAWGTIMCEELHRHVCCVLRR